MESGIAQPPGHAPKQARSNFDQMAERLGHGFGGDDLLPGHVGAHEKQVQHRPSDAGKSVQPLNTKTGGNRVIAAL